MSVSEWKVEDVYQHLMHEPWVDSKLLRAFSDHGIDGAALLELTKEDLRDDFGIAKLGQIKLILREISKLAKRADSQTASKTTNPEAEEPYFNTPSVKEKRAAPLRFQAATAAQLNQFPAPDDGDDSAEEYLQKPATPPEDISLHSITLSPIPRAAVPPEVLGGELPEIRPKATADNQQYSESRKSLSRSSMRSESPFLQASQLDLESAKKRGRPKRFREEREREDMFEQNRLVVQKFTPGLLEQERRHSCWRQLFIAWCGDPKLGFVSSEEVQAVLDSFTSPDEAEFSTKPLDGFSPSPGDALDLTEFLDYVTVRTTHLTPTIFDDLLEYFYVAIGDQESKREFARRFKLLRDLYESWRGEMDELPVEEFWTGLHTFNSWSQSEGEDYIIFDTSRISAPDEFTAPTFVEVMRTACAKFGNEDFDRMYYKLIRVVDHLRDSQRAPQERARMAVTPERLTKLLRHASPLQPVVVYGTSCDPTKAIETYARQSHATLKGCVVSSQEAETRAMRLITNQGIRRGLWVYCIVASGYAGIDDFLRSLARELQTKERWLVHEDFRLFLSLAMHTLVHVPRLLAHSCVPVPLANGD
eukprot:TRINITY_DN94332_c0_g1_i1.p1 TRINITY_DN94332_c0_g1~~TRINITY_DN94332_c0_g1_i1.p1  ORF type:complete len:589 (-),score=73.11 TRINITY_DN94332_c0_g1_i1:11-1777(-)